MLFVNAVGLTLRAGGVNTSRFSLAAEHYDGYRAAGR